VLVSREAVWATAWMTGVATWPAAFESGAVTLDVD
jgi:hypothetical protein